MNLWNVIRLVLSRYTSVGDLCSFTTTEETAKSTNTDDVTYVQWQGTNVTIVTNLRVKGHLHATFLLLLLPETFPYSNRRMPIQITVRFRRWQGQKFRCPKRRCTSTDLKSWLWMDISGERRYINMMRVVVVMMMKMMMSLRCNRRMIKRGYRRLKTSFNHFQRTSHDSSCGTTGTTNKQKHQH